MCRSTASLVGTVTLLVGMTVAVLIFAPSITPDSAAHPGSSRAHSLSANHHRTEGGQATAELIPSTGAIPRNHYKTWSLFLVCNPAWLEPEKSQDLLHLYQQFRIFGRTIGDDHVAVWFWKRRSSAADPNLAENVDVERSVRFCQALGLTPSVGPHLVVTTEYPDESKLPADRAVFELAGLRPADVTKLLRKLTDELVLKGKADELLLKSMESSSGKEAAAAPPSLWIRLLEAAQRTIVGFGCKVSVKIQTGFLNAELRECKTQ
jgi:hypothetical protein